MWIHGRLAMWGIKIYETLIWQINIIKILTKIFH